VGVGGGGVHTFRIGKEVEFVSRPSNATFTQSWLEITDITGVGYTQCICESTNIGLYQHCTCRRKVTRRFAQGRVAMTGLALGYGRTGTEGLEDSSTKSKLLKTLVFPVATYSCA